MLSRTTPVWLLTCQMIQAAKVTRSWLDTEFTKLQHKSTSAKRRDKRITEISLGLTDFCTKLLPWPIPEANKSRHSIPATSRFITVDVWNATKFYWANVGQSATPCRLQIIPCMIRYNKYNEKSFFSIMLHSAPSMSDFFFFTSIMTKQQLYFTWFMGWQQILGGSLWQILTSRCGQSTHTKPKASLLKTQCSLKIYCYCITMPYLIILSV